VSTADALRSRILTGPAEPEIGAFFDFDGTLIDGASALAFYRHRLRHFEIDPVELARTLLVGWRGVATQEQFADVLALSLAAWTGRSEDDLAELGERLFRQDIAGTLFPEAWRLVAAHLKQGHTVVITSSATRFQVAPLARELGVEHIVCTEVETEDGMLTGRSLGPVPFGAGKAAAARRFAAGHGIDLTSSYAYSNGAEDVPLLQAVGQPQVVNPDSGLAAAATDAGWPVHRFGSRKGPGLQQTLRTVAAYGGMVSGISAGLGLGLVNWNRRQGIDLSFGLAGDIGMALAGLSVTVHGEEHLWSHRPAVFLVNHQSMTVDALVIFKLLRGGFSAVAKKEAATMPVFGPFLQFADFAFVERGNPGQAKAALNPAVDKLRAGISLVVAPEGTRSYTARLGPFKKGAFHLAMQAGVPIVPIVIRNAGEFMARGARTIRPGTVEVVVHPPISVAGWSTQTLDEKVTEVRALYLQTLDQLPAAPAAPAARHPTLGASSGPDARKRGTA